MPQLWAELVALRGPKEKLPPVERMEKGEEDQRMCRVCLIAPKHRKRGICIECERVRLRLYKRLRRESGRMLKYVRNPDHERRRELDRISRQKPERKEAARQARLKRISTPEGKLKSSCRSKTSYAIKTGKLIRLPCEVCGNQKSEAHHDDYTKPLQVRWLCNIHHKRHHYSIDHNFGKIPAYRT